MTTASIANIYFFDVQFVDHWDSSGSKPFLSSKLCKFIWHGLPLELNTSELYATRVLLQISQFVNLGYKRLDLFQQGQLDSINLWSHWSAE